MNSATFRLMRIVLGLSVDDVARVANVAPRTVHRWEATHTPPDDVVEWISNLWEYAQDVVDQTMENFDIDDTIDVVLHPNHRADGDEGTRIRLENAITGLAAFSLGEIPTARYREE